MLTLLTLCSIFSLSTAVIHGNQVKLSMSPLVWFLDDPQQVRFLPYYILKIRFFLQYTNILIFNYF